MEISQVRYFLTLSRELNCTRAAELCHVSQPALTKAIKNLEEELGGELFRRERGNTHLTDLGRLIQPHFEQVFSATETAREEAASFRKVKKAPLRLGVMCTISPHVIVGFLRAVRERIPTVELAINEHPGAALIEIMMKGGLDMALIGMPKLPPRLDAIPLYTERYGIAKSGENNCAAANGKHSCAGQAKVDFNGQEFKEVANGTCEQMNGSLKPFEGMNPKIKG